MRSPEDMRIIQIDITNACVHTCSNCSRMCGHHAKPFFMNFQTFKRAVDSMDGYEGTVGMMGGEPTIHPEFERFAEYLASKYPPKGGEHNLIAPTENFMRNLKLEERSRTEAYEEKAGINERIKGPGLWSSLVSNYAKHYETIQDTFIYQCVNDHTDSSFHQPVMVTRKDLGISDEEWYTLRDKCWMQMNWSATITPKGAFFCEVAGALDMLFDGPGGWPIEPGWWKRKPEDFGEQLKWCEWCGLALETRSRDANDGADDVSPSFLERLKKVNSPKLKKGLVYAYHKEESKNEELIRHNNYQDNDFNRLGKYNRSIYPKGFVLAVFSDKSGQYDKKLLENTVNSGMNQFDRIIIFGGHNSFDNDKVSSFDDYGVGKNINKINELADDLYVVCVNQGIELSDDFTRVLSRYAINPGTMHIYKSFKNSLCLVKNDVEEGELILYNPTAHAIRDYGFDRLATICCTHEFVSLWKDEKIVIFDDEMLSQKSITNAITVESGKKYFIYGTGKLSNVAISIVKKSGGIIVGMADSDEKKWGNTINGFEVKSPTELVDMSNEFDKVLVGSTRYYNEIVNKLHELGLPDERIVKALLIEE